MSYFPPTRAQRVIPYLIYADAKRSMRYLCDVFGFKEELVYPMEDGRVGHAELTLDGNVIYLASEFEGFGVSPQKLPDTHCSLYWLVDDADAHFKRARDAGATVVSEPADAHGQRAWRALDAEGHRWSFVTPLKETRP
ncbi:MAG: VOC family protein [Myxococcaceae bacterium]|nr:VOC family protein [Myxococcaceae bacterium]